MPGDITRYNVPFVAPALPNAPAEYSQIAANENNRALRIYFNQIDKALRTQTSSTITPAQFGAGGDGSDDTAAILDMVAYVKNNGGGTIDLEDKIYSVGATVAFGVPVTLLCGAGAGFRALTTGTYTSITGRSGAVNNNPDNGNPYTVLFDIDGMAYSAFHGRFILTSNGQERLMGGEVKYLENVVAIAQQDGSGPVQALNGYFESLYITRLHCAFFQPEKVTNYGPVLPYTRTWFARLEIIKCYQAWNFLHVNGFDDCAAGVLRVNKCAADAYAKAFDLDAFEAFFAGGKATADGTFTIPQGASVNAGSFVDNTRYRITTLGSGDWNAYLGTSGITYAVGDFFIATDNNGSALTGAVVTAGNNTFTVSADADVAVGDAVMVKDAETYGQGFVTKIATLSGTSGTFEDPGFVAVTNKGFIFAAGGFDMDRATFVCAKLYLEGVHYKLLHFTRQATLDAQTLKFSTGEFAYYGLRAFTGIQIPPDTGPFYNFFPNHNCTIKMMMTRQNFVNFGMEPIEVGHTIYSDVGKPGGIREHSTSDSQLFVEYSDQTVKVSGDIGGTPMLINDGKLRVDNSAAATTLGSVAKKIEVFSEGGVSLGFIPVYSTIT